MNSPSLSTLCVVLLIMTGGCLSVPLGGPAKQDRPVTVVLNNSANTTQTFEVTVVQTPVNVTVHRDDNKSANYSLKAELTTHSSGEYHYFTAVEFPDSARTVGRYTLSPGDTKTFNITTFPPNVGVVVVLHQSENEIGWWAGAQCDDLSLVAVGVTSRPNPDTLSTDAGASYRCA